MTEDRGQRPSTRTWIWTWKPVPGTRWPRPGTWKCLSAAPSCLGVFPTANR